MKKPVDASAIGREEASTLWLHSVMPMVTVTKTVKVSRIVRLARKHGLKFNALLCYCIVKTASEIPEFHNTLEQEQFFTYDTMAVQVIVYSHSGRLRFCDVPYSGSLQQFLSDYAKYTRMVFDSDEHHLFTDRAVVGTSALPGMEIDSVVNQYLGTWNNPFLVWGRYRREFLFRYHLPISLQFHHVLMDGSHVVRFFNGLQKNIDCLSL